MSGALDGVEAAASVRTADAAAAAATAATKVEQERAAAKAQAEAERKAAREQQKEGQQQQQQLAVKQEPQSEEPAGVSKAEQEDGAAVAAAVASPQDGVQEGKATAQGAASAAPDAQTGSVQPPGRLAVQANVPQQDGEWSASQQLHAGGRTWQERTGLALQRVSRDGQDPTALSASVWSRPLVPLARLAGPVRPFVSVDVCPWDIAELPEWREALRTACKQWQEDAAEALAQARAARRLHMHAPPRGWGRPWRA